MGANCSLLLSLCGRAPKSEPQPCRASGTIRGTITATDILPVADEGRSGDATFYFVEGTGFKGTF